MAEGILTVSRISYRLKTWNDLETRGIKVLETFDWEKMVLNMDDGKYSMDDYVHIKRGHDWRIVNVKKG